MKSRVIKLRDLGIDADASYKYAVSIPKKYKATDTAKPWPIIICLPDKGEAPKAHIDKYWKSPAIRASYVIVALAYEYADIEREVEKSVTDESGKVTMVKSQEKVPFTWESPPVALYFFGILTAYL